MCELKLHFLIYTFLTLHLRTDAFNYRARLYCLSAVTAFVCRSAPSSIIDLPPHHDFHRHHSLVLVRYRSRPRGTISATPSIIISNTSDVFSTVFEAAISAENRRSRPHRHRTIVATMTSPSLSSLFERPQSSFITAVALPHPHNVLFNSLLVPGLRQ